jgi:hypothetical protein
MRVYRIHSQDDPPEDLSGENSLAVNLTIVLLLGTIFAATSGWLYFLYRAAAWLLA